jgi:hypothetical protein
MGANDKTGLENVMVNNRLVPHAIERRAAHANA